MSSQPRQPRTRARRLNGLVLLLCVIAGIGIGASWMPWYAAELTSAAEASGNTENLVAVASGRDIVQATASSGALCPAPPQRFGIPLPAVLLGATALLAVAGAAAKNTFVGFVGLVAGFFSWRYIVAFRQVVENPHCGGGMATPGVGLTVFQVALAATVLLLIVQVLQTAAVNAQAREQAVAAGEEVEPSLLDLPQLLVSGALDRFQRSSPTS